MSAEDRQKEKRIAHDVASQAYNELFPAKKEDLSAEMVALKKAKMLAQRVHQQACAVFAADKTGNRVGMEQLVSQLYLEGFGVSCPGFKHWSRDDLLFMLLVIHTEQELENLGLGRPV